MAKIFLVDDQMPVLRVMKLGLEAAGFEVETAMNGAQCLEMLADDTPDFLVTDIDMPKMTGKELCFAIQEQFPQRKFPIVVLTARTEMEHRSWTRDMANMSFMEKPVSMRRLVDHVRNCLSVNEAPD